MCFIHCTSSCSGKFVIMSSPRLVARLASVQALCSLTHQVHELHHQVFLSTQFTSLYLVMMSCNSELPTFHQRLRQYAPPHTRPCCHSHFTKKSIVSYLTADTRLALTSETEWSRRRDHRPARTLFRTDVTHRLHLLKGFLDVSNICDRRLSRTLPAAFV